MPKQSPMQPDHYEAIHSAFKWHVPRHFNMAEVCSTRWANNPVTAKNTAVEAYFAGTDGQKPIKKPETAHTYADLERCAISLAALLKAQGVTRGSFVAIVLPQRFETAVAYMAVLRMGAVAVPLSQLFGPEALEYRLNDSDAVAAIVDKATANPVAQVRKACPALKHLLAIEPGVADADLTWNMPSVAESIGFVATENEAFDSVHPALVKGLRQAQPERNRKPHVAAAPVRTLADDPAVLIYTSGTTGPPKGALIPHRALIGNLTGFVASQNWFGFEPFSRSDGSAAQAARPGERSDAAAVSGASEAMRRGLPPPVGGGPGRGRATERAQPSLRATFWSPADWAWTGGLMDALLPTLYFGSTIVAQHARFSPEVAFNILQQRAITHTFLFPTALKAMMKAAPHPRKTHPGIQLQAIMSAGEAVGDAVYAWCDRELGVKVNEMFGQTEINYVVGNCNRLWPSKPGSMGKAYPGHRVALIDDAGQPVPRGQPGEVAVHRQDRHGHADPVFFLGYWKRPDATASKYTGSQQDSWCRTGDMATEDADGYLWYQGRADDMFKAAGYRIGPSEVENCLVKHPAVLNAAVVPKPDAERGAIVKAYVVVNPAWLAEQTAASDSSKSIATNAMNPWTEGQKDPESARKAAPKAPQSAKHGAAQANWQQTLTQSLQAHVKGRLAPYEYPKEIEFVEALPMTTTGKVQRRVLRLQEEERAGAGAGNGWLRSWPMRRGKGSWLI